MPIFSCRGFETKTSLQLGLSETCIALKKFRVGELVSTGTEALNSWYASQNHKMKSSHVLFSTM
jgi:hypothetical protein